MQKPQHSCRFYGRGKSQNYLNSNLKPAVCHHQYLLTHAFHPFFTP